MTFIHTNEFNKIYGSAQRCAQESGVLNHRWHDVVPFLCPVKSFKNRDPTVLEQIKYEFEAITRFVYG